MTKTMLQICILVLCCLLVGCSAPSDSVQPSDQIPAFRTQSAQEYVPTGAPTTTILVSQQEIHDNTPSDKKLWNGGLKEHISEDFSSVAQFMGFLLSPQATEIYDPAGELYSELYFSGYRNWVAQVQQERQIPVLLTDGEMPSSFKHGLWFYLTSKESGMYYSYTFPVLVDQKEVWVSVGVDCNHVSIDESTNKAEISLQDRKVKAEITVDETSQEIRRKVTFEQDGLKLSVSGDAQYLNADLFTRLSVGYYKVSKTTSQ